MAMVRRPAVLIPILLGLLIGLVSVYASRPAKVDAARPSISSLQTRIAGLEAKADDLDGRVTDLE